MKPLKASGLKELTAAELGAKLSEARDNLFKLKVRKETRQLEDVVSVRVARRDVARISTVLQQKNSSAKAEKAPAAVKE